MSRWWLLLIPLAYVVLEWAFVPRKGGSYLIGGRGGAGVYVVYVPPRPSLFQRFWRWLMN